jgi:PBSX family phage terminase large subunit
MQLSPAQAIIAKDLHRFRVVNCGRRFGKTTLAIDQMLACAAYKEARIAYIAPTFQQARDIAWEQLKKVVKDSGAIVNESRLEIKMPTVKGGVESLIVLRGWESIETLRGQLFDLIILDEVASMKNFWAAWQEVVRPTLTDRKGEVLFISTPKGFNHFYQLYNLQQEDEDFKSFHFTSYDNPHIPREEIDSARKQLSPDRFEQEYLANFTKMEGLVYKEFIREKHIVAPELADTNQWVETIVGVDFGFTNPAAVLTIKRDSSDTFYVVQELYERGKTDTEIAEYVSAIKANKVFADPQAAAAIETLRKHKVNVRDVIKGKDSVKNGIDSVRELLKADKLKICSNCVNLIQEFETYAYEESKNGQNEKENPIKDGDHALDALRYAIMMTVSRSTGASVRYAASAQPNATKDIHRVAYTYIPYL